MQRELSVVQRMQVARGEQRRSFDALLEADGEAVRLAILQLGQSIAVLHWDGVQLQTRLAPGWPEVVPGSQLLSDLQYVWWPQPAIQAALPRGWMLRDGLNRRELLHQGETIMRIDAAPKVGDEVDITLRKMRHAYTVTLQARGGWPLFAAPVAPEGSAAALTAVSQEGAP